MTGSTRVGTLWLALEPRPVAGGDVAIVLDPAWTPGPDAAGGAIPVRDTIDGLLRAFDPIVETSRLLERWANASGVIETLTIGGTSFWYMAWLRHWFWLQERVLWALVLRRLVDAHDPAAIACGAGTDPALVEVARLMAAADGRELRVDEADRATRTPGSATPAATPAVVVGRASLVRRVRRRLARLFGRGGPAAPGPPPAFVTRRLARLGAEDEARLLVVLNHAPQRIETPAGPRVINPYLGAVADRLAGTRLDPILLDWQARLADAASVARITGPGTDRMLPRDAQLVDDVPIDPAVTERARRAAAGIADVREPVVVAGIDLGPSLARDVATRAGAWFPAKHIAIERYGRLLARLPVAGVLVADEYHRQDWMEAAARARLPVAAIQHGMINRSHRGYIHTSRPPQLRLADRTYVFGSWERDLLIRDSVYREDEVVVGGSPRLDMFRAVTPDRSTVRDELGVAPGDRLVVLSGTWGGIYRRFHYPVVLARLFDRPLPRVHLVVKQHPAEQDEGPYRAVVEGVAAARGFAPPPITVVRDVDLYRLLAAADAHLGIHSTVLTEAVVVGTPNLLASGVLGGDLLDYVEAGVALPVGDGGDLLAALDAAADGAIAPAARAAFLARHFESGSAGDRIAADLLAWLSPTSSANEEP